MKSLEISEARVFINNTVQLHWTDRKGMDVEEILQIFNVEFLPLYGPCLITSVGEIRLDRVKGCALAAAKIAA